MNWELVLIVTLQDCLLLCINFLDSDFDGVNDLMVKSDWEVLIGDEVAQRGELVLWVDLVKDLIGGCDHGCDHLACSQHLVLIQLLYYSILY